MITVTVTPSAEANLYSLLTKKEIELRRIGKGTLHRAAAKKAGQAKWTHARYPGWVNLQGCIGNMVVATVQSRTPEQEWQLLSSLVGFVHRHFREEIASINIAYSTT